MINSNSSCSAVEVGCVSGEDRCYTKLSYRFEEKYGNSRCEERLPQVVYSECGTTNFNSKKYATDRRSKSASNSHCDGSCHKLMLKRLIDFKLLIW